IFGEFCPPTRGARQSKRNAATKLILRNVRMRPKRAVPFSTPERRLNREEPGSTAGLLAMDLPPSCRSESCYLRRRYAHQTTVSRVRGEIAESRGSRLRGHEQTCGISWRPPLASAAAQRTHWERVLRGSG